ncbi:MAG: MBL fold metallo-hydrolase [Bdellovibrio sp.]
MKPHHGRDQFYNNYENSPKPSFWKWQWERLTSPNKNEEPFHPEIIKTNTEYLRKNHVENTLTWIGHSSTFLQVDGVNILIDPIFSERVSPVSFLGPKRQAAVPFKMDELPPVDVVLLSHNHYDHMDIPTLKNLAGLYTNTLFLVPLGNQKFLNNEGIKNVKEMDWWDSYNIKTAVLTFVPAQHWSQRNFFDYKKTLWGGWHVATPKNKILYSGDTGYSKDFQDIHKKLGDVDVAIIPIGCYEPQWFMKLYHVNPEEALQIHQDIKAKLSIGVHWGTFRLSDEPMSQPPIDLQKALKKYQSHHSGDFRVLKHGETIKI